MTASRTGTPPIGASTTSRADDLPISFVISVLRALSEMAEQECRRLPELKGDSRGEPETNPPAGINGNAVADVAVRPDRAESNQGPEPDRASIQQEGRPRR